MGAAGTRRRRDTKRQVGIVGARQKIVLGAYEAKSAQPNGRCQGVVHGASRSIWSERSRHAGALLLGASVPGGHEGYDSVILPTTFVKH